MKSFTLSASRAGLGSVIVTDTVNKTQVISNVGAVVASGGAPFVIHPFV